MDQDKGPKQWLTKLLKKEDSPDKKTGKYQYLVLVLLFGAAIMIISNMLFKDDAETSTGLPVMGQADKPKEDVETFGQKNSGGNDVITDYQHQYETELKDALEGITGVSDVTVVVNVDATDKKVLEKNTTTKSQITDETDREGGQRKVEDQSKDEQLVIIRNGEKEVPVVVETKKPEIRGVLVVAKGANNIEVKKWIIEAVTRLLDVPVHKVSVMPKK